MVLLVCVTEDKHCFLLVNKIFEGVMMENDCGVHTSTRNCRKLQIINNCLRHCKWERNRKTSLTVDLQSVRRHPESNESQFTSSHSNVWVREKLRKSKSGLEWRSGTKPFCLFSHTQMFTLLILTKLPVFIFRWLNKNVNEHGIIKRFRLWRLQRDFFVAAVFLRDLSHDRQTFPEGADAERRDIVTGTLSTPTEEEASGRDTKTRTHTCTHRNNSAVVTDVSM